MKRFIIKVLTILTMLLIIVSCREPVSKIKESLTIPKYTITFNSNGGTLVAPITAENGQIIKTPVTPTKKGYSFDGWYKEATFVNLWKFTNDKITADTTLFAKWVPVKYKVNFNSNNGTPVNTIETSENSLINEPTAPTKENFKFEAWYKEDTFTTKWDFATDKITANTTLHAKWNAVEVVPTVKYIVNFVSNNDALLSNQEILENGLIEIPKTLEKTGYTFEGWHKDDKFATKWDFAIDKVMANTTLYAKWTPTEYTVSFNDGANKLSEIKVNYDNTFVAPSIPTKVGYIFEAWYKDDKFLTKWDFATDKVTANTTLYANWTPIVYTVNFVSNGGTATVDELVKYDKTFSEPTAPTKVGNTFGGWYKDDKFATKWDFATYKVTANITLYANWIPIKYTVSFNSNDGTLVNNQEIEINSLVVHPSNPTRENYTFEAWYKDDKFATKWDFATDKVTANTTLYANWTINEYRVNFVSNCDTNIVDKLVNYDNTVAEPMSPSKTGYTFEGWYKDDKFATKWDFATDKVKSNITLYANWTPIEYTVNFVSNGDIPVNDIKVKYGNSLEAPTPSPRTGYVFDGWYSDKLLSSKYDTTLMKVWGDTTLYAKWIAKVTFDHDDGTSVTTQDVLEGTCIKEPEIPIREGYEFKGWFMIFQGQAIPWNFEEYNLGLVLPELIGIGIENITLHANWYNPNQKFKVTFNSKGGSEVPFAEVKIGTLATEPTAPTRDGYIFDGWYNNEECSYSPWDFSSWEIDEDTTLYAKWRKAVVSFNTDGGSVVGDIEVLTNETIGEQPIPTKKDYKFEGWYKDQICTIPWDFATDKTSANITLYAKWSLMKYKVNFVSNGGTPIDYQEIEANSKVSEPILPTKEDSTLEAWYTDENFTTKWDFASNTITTNTTLYAKWSSLYLYQPTGTNNEIYITGYTGTKTDLIIPEYIDNKKVVEIFNGAFINKQLKSIVIPNSVTIIGRDAFAKNQLTSLVIPNSVTIIGSGAFSQNQLTSVTIGDSVTTIQYYAFSQNQLTSVIIPDSVTLIEDHAFWVNQLTSVTIGNSVENIGICAFSNNQLTSVTIGDSVKDIGWEAFADNKLTSVTIGNSVKNINSGVFFKNQLTSVIIPNSVISIGEEAFADNQLTSIVIPDSVTTIGDSSFSNNQLTSVTIGDSVKDIGWRAFANNQLTSVTIGNSVENIGIGAFSKNQLTSVIIPNSVINIRAHAFAVNKLTSIVIPNSVTLIGSYAFGNNKFTDDTLPSTVVTREFGIFDGNPIQYTVKFNDSNLPDQKVLTGTPITRPETPTKENYTFVGWYKDATLISTWDFFYTIKEHTTLYANWKINEYTVSFDSDSGTPIADKLANHNDTVVEPMPPQRVGYTFEGWYTDNTYATQWIFSNAPVTRNMTLYAKWKASEILVEAGTAGTSGITTTKSFYIHQFEVIQSQYVELMGYNPSAFKVDNHPVEGVTWYDAITYANKLSEKEGLDKFYNISDVIKSGNKITSATVTENSDTIGYRLPTLNEWQYVAYGGKLSQNFTYAGSDNVNDVAWISSNITTNGESSGTKEIGRKEANELGIYDMSGNVWEWADEEFMGNVYILGGTWTLDEAKAQLSYTQQTPKYGYGSDLGFRLVRDY